MSFYIKIFNALYLILFKHFIVIFFTFCVFLYTYTLSKLPNFNILQVVSNFLETLVCSGIFYFFVSFIPLKRRKGHIKKITLMAYEEFKREIIEHLVSMSKQEHKDVKALFEPRVFRQNFPSEKLYKVANSLYNNEKFMHEWRLKSRLLRDEIILLLSFVEHSDEQAYTSLKILCWRLQELESVDLVNDYEAQKNLMRFFVEMFAGWSFITGYSDYDVAKESIRKL